MGLLSNIAGILRPRAATPAPESDFWYEEVGAGSSNAGIKVTPDVALKASAVYACVKVLAETIATLPLQMYEELPAGREPAPNHPIDTLIRSRPNGRMTAIEFWEMMVLHGALRGTAYAEIIPGPRGAVDQLMPLHPDRVKPELLRDGSLRFQVTNPQTGDRRVLLQDEIFRIPGMSSDGISGIRAVDVAAEAIGLGMAADQYAGRVFRNNLNLGVAVKHPGKLSDEAQKNIIHKLMLRFAGSENAHRPIVLQEGMGIEVIGQKAHEAQLLEARRQQTIEMARYWRIPLHMLGVHDSQPRANVEQEALDLVKYTLRPWVRRIEQAISRDLIIAPQRYSAKFNMEGLLRGDAKSRAEYFSAALGASGRAAWMTPNEVRAIEGMNPSDDPRAEVLGGILPQKAAPQASNGGQPAARIEDDSLRARADRLVRKEVAAIRRARLRHAGDAAAFRAWVATFYGGHVSEVMEALQVEKPAARVYCKRVRDQVLATDDLDALLEEWEKNGAESIAAALEREAA